MGYIASSWSRSYNQASGQGISVTLAQAGLVGDVYVALTTCGDQLASDPITGVSSSNITWQLAKDASHTGNQQDFEVWIGRVHTAFNAASEVVTMSMGSADNYREIACAGYRAETGYRFDASTYFENAQVVTHNASSNPTTTDGFTCTPVLSGNGKHLLLGVGFFEDSGGNTTNASPGTNYTQDQEWAVFGVNVTGLFESRLYDGASNQAVTATYNALAAYMTSLVGIALLQVPDGVPPHARGYGPDRAGVFTGLRM